MEKISFRMPFPTDATKEESLVYAVMSNLDEVRDIADDAAFAAEQLEVSLRKLLRYLEVSAV